MIEGLSLLRVTDKYELTAVRSGVGHALGSKHFLLLVEIEVDKTCRTVGKDIIHSICNQGVIAACSRILPSDHDILSLKSVNFL